jgi:hypothetical protein
MALNFIEGWSTSKPLLIFLVCMVIYSIFVFSFYKFLARRDLFKINLTKYNTSKRPLVKKTVRVLFYIFEHILIYPFWVLLWFTILATLITLLSRNQGAQTIMLVTASLIGSVRATAYINEDLANDLSKMLPFALLGVFLVDVAYVSISNSAEIVMLMVPLWEIAVYYMLLLIILELALRFFYELYRHLFKSHKSEVKLPNKQTVTEDS